MTTYSLRQQVFCLNLLSNIASSRKGNQQQLELYARQHVHAVVNDCTIAELIEKWQVAQVGWGPVVYQAHHSQYADNTMFVAKKSDSNIYVIAIAGTNPLSRFGWVTEDGEVEKTVKWPYGAPDNHLCISEGTSKGLNILLNMEYKGEKLLQFLHRISQQPLELHVSGHSLGGALSPSLALALFDLKNQWDPNGNATIEVLPTAGATPGDTNFASYYDSKLGDHTDRIWNQKDIVPHAWELNMLAQIPDLYSPKLQPNLLIEAAVTLAEGWSSAAPGSYLHICKQTPGFPSEVNTTTPVLDASIDGVASLIVRALLNKLGIHKPWKIVVDTLTTLTETIIKQVLHYGESGEIAISFNEDHIQGIIEPHLQAMEILLQEHKGSISPKELNHSGWWGEFFSWLRSNLSGFLEFLSEAGYQHTTAYINHLGVTDFYKRAQELRG